MTERVTLTENWQKVATGVTDVLVTLESGGAFLHVVDTTDEAPANNAAGHYLTGDAFFEGHLDEGEWLYVKGRGAIVLTGGGEPAVVE